MNKRAHWTSNIGFLLAAVGSAVGLGNIWRFSYMVYKNGGSAFLIPYFIALLTIGIPILVLEYGIGYWRKGSAPKALRDIDERWEWLGWWIVSFVMFGIVIYYCVVIAWCLNYFLLSFKLFWNSGWGNNTNEYFFKNFLNLSSSITNIGSINFKIALANLFIWLICWFICYKGIAKGIEKANKIFMPLLFFLTLALVIWSFFLKGSKIGYDYYFLKPDFSKLRDIKVWIDAYTQNFFTLSVGFGIMIAYASYLPPKTSIVKNAFLTGLLNHGYSFMTGFAVFGVLGYMSQSQGVPISKIVKEGVGLAFVAFPQAINTLPFGRLNAIVGIIFFFCLVIAGISSAISIIEAFSSAILDKFHFHRRHVVTILFIIGFLGGLIFTTSAGLYFLDIIDHFLTNYALVITGILECVIVGWFLSTKLLISYLIKESPATGIKKKILSFFLFGFWSYCIRFLSPAILITIFVLSIKSDVSKPYGGYDPVYLLVIGVGSLVVTHIIGYTISCFRWKDEPEENYWDEELS